MSVKYELMKCCGFKPKEYYILKFVRGYSYKSYQFECHHCNNKSKEDTLRVEAIKDWNSVVVNNGGSSEPKFPDRAKFAVHLKEGVNDE